MKRYCLVCAVFIFLCITFTFSDYSSAAESSFKSLPAIVNFLLGQNDPKAISAHGDASQTNGVVPLSVTFTTISTGPVHTWRWDFDGDGSWDWEGNTREDQPYTFTAVGSYTSILQVEDNLGNTASNQIVITVAPPPDPPSITFNTEDEQVFTGQSTLLTWSVTGASSVAIDQGIGEVAADDSEPVSPSTVTLYTLTASGPGGTSKADIEVRVINPDSEELVLYISNPIEGEHISGETVTVNGVVNQSTAPVWVNGVSATVSGQNFSAQVPLVPGMNEINATASFNDITAKDSTWVIRDYVYTPQPEGSFGKQYEDLVPDDAAVPFFNTDRFAVITGLVENEQATPLQGVAVNIKNRPEYGTAYTDSAGRFSLPVEGGTRHTVVYQHANYLTAHRKVDAVLNDINTIDLVHLVVQDSVVSSFSFDGNGATILTHESSLVSDSFGSRSMTMVFQGDNHAYEMDANGQRIRELTRINTRATEFTTPESMPAILPFNSAFTYCAELTIDGVGRVEFAKPVVTWVDNFLGFDVGEVVPMGYYNRDTGEWVPSENGFVVQLLDDDSNGSVDSLDATGDGVPDDLNGNGSFDDEVTGLDDLSRYPISGTFWRVEVHHFTPYDENWPTSVQSDAIPPNPSGLPVADQKENDSKKDPCEEDIASSVEPRSRIFHEDIPVPGTGYSMHYMSSRVDGFHTVIDVPASGETVPASLLRIEVTLQIAGREMAQTLDAAPNQRATFSWDGLDYLGRRVTQPTTGHIRVGFVYQPVFQSPNPDFEMAFAQQGLSPTAIRARMPQTISQESNLTIIPPGTAAADSWHLANGWTFSSQHSLLPTDPTVMHKGNGEKVQNHVAIIDTYAGSDEYHCHDGMHYNLPAAEAGFSQMGPNGIVIDSKGNTFISVWGCESVYKIDPDGILNHFAGIEEQRGFSGDGGPANSAMLSYPYGLAVDADDNLYIAAYFNNRVRKVDSNGIITTVVGNGGSGSSCDYNCDPTAENTIMQSHDVEVDSNGNIYTADGLGGIGKVDPNGVFTTIAGRNYSGTEGPYADGLPATDVDFYVMAFALAPDGSIYFTSGWDNYVGKIDPNGIFHVLAGGDTSGFSGDGGPATAALLNEPHGIALDLDGNIYFYDNGNKRIRKIDTLGTITTVVGTGVGGFGGDGGPATHATIGDTWSHASSNFCDLAYYDNKLYLADQDNGRLRIITLPEPAFEIGTEPGDITFAEDNGQGHIFTAGGRHKKTMNLHTGATLLNFSYDSEGKLTSAIDIHGQQTTLQYNSNGVPVSIISPDGLITGLTVDTENQLTRIAYPGGANYDFSYGDGALLTEKTEPNGNIFTHSFNSDGRLTTINDENGGSWDYSRTVAINAGATAQVTTGESNITIYFDGTSSSGGTESTITYPSGSSSTSIFSNDGLTQTLTPSCGGEQTVQYNTDSRYRTQFLQQLQVNTPGGLSKSITNNRTYVDTNGDETPDLITGTITLNGKEHVDVINTLAHIHSTTSPVGRVESRSYDPQSLVTTGFSVPGIFPLQYSYNSKGELTNISQENRSVSMLYDGHGFLQSTTEPDGRSTTYTHDQIGRITSKTNPAAGITSFAYDGNGNLSALVPPDGVAHSFTYNSVNRISGYLLPGGTDNYSYSYDNERRLTSLRFPSGGQKINTYLDTRLSSSQTPDGTISFSYFPGGKVDTVSRGSESISFTYDAKLLVSTTSAGTLNQTVGLAYNNDFLVTALSYAGATQNLTYDNDGLLTAAAADITRNAVNGLPEQVSDGALTQTRTFNGYGEFSAESSTVTTNSVASWSITRDQYGHITEKTETMAGTTHAFAYTYDSLDRLLTVTRDAALVESYQYDANGNRTLANGTASLYDNQDRLTSAGSTTYSYTKDGFLLSKTSGGDTTTYNYTLRGELLSATLPPSDGRTIQYTYDPLGRRIARTDGTMAEKYLWNGRTQLLAIYDGDDNLLMRFQYADHRMPISMVDQAGDLYYLFYDYIGSLRLVTSDIGEAVKQIDYDAFGNVISDTNPSLHMPLGFAGGLPDRDTGLIHFGERDYAPLAGRWTAKDTLFFTGGETNLYAYVSNDPVRYFDSTGQKKKSAFEQTLSIKDDVTGTGFIERMLEKGSGYLYETADALAKVNRDMRNSIDHCYERNEKRYKEALAKNKELRKKGKKYSELFKQGYEFAQNAPDWVADAGGKAMDTAKDTIKSYITDGLKSLSSMF